MQVFDNWFRDHIRYFVTPALLAKERYQYSASCKVGIVDKDAEQIVMLMIKDQKPVLNREHYRLMLDSLNALENRAKGLSVILPGRDVWPFYVLMQKRKTWKDRIYFFPWLSRSASANSELIKRKFGAEGIDPNYLENYCFLFDTGFAGSIFKGIKDAIDKGSRCKTGLVSADEWKLVSHRCILQHNIYRTQVLTIEENYPKYFSSGDYYGDQHLNYKTDILRTARLTYDLWHGITKEH